MVSVSAGGKLAEGEMRVPLLWQPVRCDFRRRNSRTAHQPVCCCSVEVEGEELRIES